MPNSFYVQSQGVLVVLVTIFLISSFFVNLGYDIIWEFSFRGDLDGLVVDVALHESLNFDIVFEFKELVEYLLSLVVRNVILSQVVDGVVLYLYLQDGGVRSSPEELNFNIKVVDHQLLSLAFVRAMLENVLNFNHIVSKEANELFLAFDRVLFFLLEGVEDSEVMLLSATFFHVFRHGVYDELAAHELSVDGARSEGGAF